MPANPFLQAPSERLAQWKTFRRNLQKIDLDTQINEVAAFWSLPPIGPRAYDPADCASWLTPWEMIHNNQWCRSSVAIAMEHTLRLSGLAADRLRLRLISDPIHDALLVLVVDDDLVLNYDWGSVRRLPLNGHDVISEWQFTDRNYIQLI